MIRYGARRSVQLKLELTLILQPCSDLFARVAVQASLLRKLGIAIAAFASSAKFNFLVIRMAANPALSVLPQTGQATQVPALYAHEVIALQRDSIDFSINGLRHQSGK